MPWKPVAPESNRVTYDRTRKKTAERGYDTATWGRFRRWFLNNHPICADCGREPATEVHHLCKVRDYPRLRLVESNCLGLDKGCHSKRTARGE